jgi:hypothetical protein
MSGEWAMGEGFTGWPKATHHKPPTRQKPWVFRAPMSAAIDPWIVDTGEDVLGFPTWASAMRFLMKREGTK